MWQKKWEKQEEEKHEDSFTQSTPKELFNGECNHYYEDAFLDAEGVMNAGCTKCPMGRRYKPEEFEIKDGKICQKQSRKDK